MPLPSPVADEVRDLISLQLVPGLGPRLTAALLERFGSAAAVLQASSDQLAEVPHIGAKLAGEMYQAMRSLDTAKELEIITRFDARVLVLGTPEYPAVLSHIPDPPHLLYMRGALDPRDANAVGIVGSRQCTPYGRRIAERLAAGLVKQGFTVISGLARGIDAAVHRGALEAGGRTLAVLAGGLSKIYPPEHDDLAREVQGSGALLSEAAMSMQPLAGMFPARNRLISGLSRGVVVVEAAEKSGALITARHAAEQGRAIFAVPGPVDSAASGGTLKLLRDGATLVRHVEDIVEELDGISPLVPPVPTQAPPGLNDLQQRIWDALGNQPRHVDELTRHLGLAVHELAGALMLLEMKKVLRRLPGNQYERR